MRKMTKMLLVCFLFLTAFFCGSIGYCTAAEAEGTPQAEFAVDSVDANGYFTMKLNVKNAEFAALQFCMRFNPDAVKTVEFSTGNISSDFSKCMKVADPVDYLRFIGTEISFDNGLIDFSAIVPPDQANSGLVNADGNIETGSDELEILSLRFKKIGDEAAGFTLATADSGQPYCEGLPHGGGLVANAAFLDTQVSFDIPAELGEKTTKLYVDEGNKNNEQASVEASTEQVVSMSKEARTKDTIALQIGNYAATTDGKLSKIDPDNNMVVPYIKNDRTYVPLRFISEKLGADVSWDQANRQAVISKSGNIITVPIGSEYYLLNGVQYPQDAPAEIVNDRTFIPIRFVAEALGKNVYWSNSNRIVIIAPKATPWTGETQVEKELLSDFILVMSPLIRDFS